MVFMKNHGEEPNYAELARRYNCDYRTVKRYFEGDGSLKERKKNPSKLDKFKEIIEDKLELGCTYASIYHFIKKLGYDGKYTIVREYANKVKVIKTKKATVRFETMPGLQAQVDWKEHLTMISREGEVFTVNIFLLVLGYSRLKFLKLTLDRNQDTLKEALVEGFKYIGGIPKEILFDNMKTVIDQSRSHFMDAVVNEDFYAFSKHMGFEVIACRAYRPETKGKVEALAKFTSRLQPYNHDFVSLDELNEIVKMVNDDINHEISQATNEIPLTRHKNEKEYLLPLPRAELLLNFLTKPLTRIVTKESLITYQNNKYSLPPYYIGKTLTIKPSAVNLDIFDNGVLIMRHPLSNKKYNYKKEHYIEILKSDALPFKNDDDINRIAEKNLKLYDNL